MGRPQIWNAFMLILITCMIAIAIHNPGNKGIDHTPNIQLPTLEPYNEETPK